MATLLDTAVLQFLSPIFVFIFVFAIFYVITTRFKMFSDNKTVHAFIAFAAAMLFILVPSASKLISISTPWFVILLFFFMFVILIFMFLGVKEETITDVVQGNGAILTVIISAAVIIFLIAIYQVYGPVLMYPGAEETGVSAFTRRAIFNPKFLGVILLLLIAERVISNISHSSK